MFLTEIFICNAFAKRLSHDFQIMEVYRPFQSQFFSGTLFISSEIFSLIQEINGKEEQTTTTTQSNLSGRRTPPSPRTYDIVPIHFYQQ